MPVKSATKARANLFALIDQVGTTHEPVQIKGKRGSAFLVSEADWRSIQSTLHLLSVPGMRESLIEARNTPISDCSDDLGVEP